MMPTDRLEMIIRILLFTVFDSRSLCIGDVSLLPSRVDVWEHSDVTFLCTNQAKTMTTIRWYKNSEAVPMQIKENTCRVHGFLIDPTLYSFSCINDTTFSITLKNISRARLNEEWKCMSHSSGESNIVKILVKVPATTATIEPRKRVISTVENATFSPLHCFSNECRPKPTFLWYMDQNTDSSEDDILLWEDSPGLNSTNKIQTHTSTFPLTTNRSMHGWFVFCALRHRLEDRSISDKILLNITVRMITTEGDNFTYLCNVTNASLEVTHVTWRWKDKVLYGQQLTLNNVSRTQAGIYVCRVNNITNKSDGSPVYSSEMGNIQLNVEYKTQVLNLLANSNRTTNHTVSEHDAVDISCNIEGNPLPEGELTFIEANYTRNANIVTKIKTSFKRNSTNLQLVTQLDAKCTDAGQYTCTGWNTLHNGTRTESSDSLKLFVKCTPRMSPFHEIHDRVFSALSSDVTLSFTALAYPVPPQSGFVWFKKGLGNIWETINSSCLRDTRTTTSTSGLQSNLIIKTITEQDFGLYKLMIENEVGKFEYTFNLSATPQPVDDDRTLVILAEATGGTVLILLVLLTKQSLFAVIVVRRSSQRSNAGVTTDPREVDGSQATHNFSQDVDGPAVYEELLGDEQKQHNA